MKKAILILLSLSFLSFVQAQNFKEGYYISTENDTVYGWINFGSDYLNSLSCEFKKNKNDITTQTFHPYEIKAYRLVNDDFFYISKTFEDRKLFLQYLVEGEMNLYFWEDEKSNPYYFFEENAKITRITKKPDELVGSYIQKDVSYKSKLAKLFYTQPSLFDKIDDLDFSQKKMIELTEDYHNLTCTTGEKCIVYTTQNPDKKYLRIRPTISVSYNRLQIRENFEIVNGPFYFPLIGIGFYLQYPRLSQQSFTVIESNFFYEKHDEVPSTLVRLNVGQKYLFNSKRVAPNIEGGVYFTTIFESNMIIPYDFGLYLAGGLDYKITEKKSFSLQLGYNAFAGNLIFIEGALETLYLKLKFAI